MSGSSHRQQATVGPARPISAGSALSIPVMPCSSALPTPFGGFGVRRKRPVGDGILANGTIDLRPVYAGRRRKDELAHAELPAQFQETERAKDINLIAGPRIFDAAPHSRKGA